METKSHRHFDLHVLGEVLGGKIGWMDMPQDGGRWLVLSGYETYTEEAVEALAGSVGEVEGLELEFRNLSVRAANALSTIKTFHVILPDLNSLSSNVAQCLRWPRGSEPILAIGVDEQLSASSALSLAKNCSGAPLEIAVPSIDADVAAALAKHDHDLSLHIRGNHLSPEVGAVLAFHTGYAMTLEFDGPTTKDVMEALSRNPAKRTRQAATPGWSRIYVVDHEMWCDFYEDDSFWATQPNQGGST